MSLIISKKLDDKIALAKEEQEQTISRSKFVYVDYDIPKKDRVKVINAKFNFIPYFDRKNNQRSAVFISGPSGVGKSTFAANLVKTYREMLKQPKRKVVLFKGSIEPDMAFDGMKNFFDVPFSDKYYPSITTEHLRECIVIFDDYTSLKGNMFKHTIGLIEDILERSRKMDIQVIIISHLTQDYNKTRKILLECDTYVVFPSGNPKGVEKFLTSSYNEIDKDVAKDIVENKCDNAFSWLAVHKSVPRYCLTQNEIMLL
jgi:hypothetical protein